MEDLFKSLEQPVQLASKKPKVNKAGILLVVGGLVVGLLIGLATSPIITGSAVSAGTIENKIDAYLSDILTDQGVSYRIISVDEEDSFYNVQLELNQSGVAQVVPVMVTKDGKYIISQYAPLEVEDDSVPQTDEPEVELFVMSYCPYGLQMEKAILPVQELLKDVADFKIRFVHYLMHGEVEATENTRDYCIQKEEPEKFWAYLKCFISSGTDGEDNGGAAEACMLANQIDASKINTCMDAANTEFGIQESLATGETYPRYGVDAEASEAYGVQGSPTLVVNGVVVSVGRTPEEIKTAVCSAFGDMPAECETELSSEGFEPGFGFEAGSGDTTASCG